MKPVVELKRISKNFGAFSALRGIDFDVYPGEIHALLGDNGAGKSTLIKILAGVHRQTEGQILVRGKPMKFRSPRDAADVGIGTVYQDLALAPLMTVARNFFMGRELIKGPELLGMLDDRRMARVALEEMAKIGIELSDAKQPVGTLSGGQRQSLAIARAIYFGANVLILDEPTSALGQKQQLEVLKSILRVRARGDIAIIFITHNEIHAQLTADRYTFLSLGEVIGSGSKVDLNPGEIRRLMAGGAEVADLDAELSAIVAQHSVQDAKSQAHKRTSEATNG
ncbi:MAG: ATP-binding cassette domain-containing protein [Rhodobacteraceae bacterium]|nr:ATP-binding cassette domain-containing protein [Paracoccaceae bacterium]